VMILIDVFKREMALKSETFVGLSILGLVIVKHVLILVKQ
jgi:hypothetical protein